MISLSPRPDTVSRPVNAASRNLKLEQQPRYEFLQKDQGEWSSGYISIEDLCTRSLPEISIAFLPKEDDLLRLYLDKPVSDRFNIPPHFWASITQLASGFFRSANIRNGDDSVRSYSTMFRVLIKEASSRYVYSPNEKEKYQISYVWHKISFYTAWTPSNKVIILCFDLPESLKKTVVSALLEPTSRLDTQDPYSTHVFLLWKIIELYDHALWSSRDLVRHLEENRPSPQNPDPDYPAMHELARHAIHSSEMLAMGLEILANMTAEHEMFLDENPLLPKEAITISRQTKRDFRFHKTVLTCLHMRSKALEERLKNEMNLAFNTVAQHDSTTSVQIAEAMQADSVSMKTISVLGLVFLPGTFICAIFSTSFFNFSPGNGDEPQRWVVSDQFWIYWAVAIPVTVTTLICWFAWHSMWRKQKMLQK